MQLWPVGHGRLHPPQWADEVCVLVHAPEHTVWPVGHWHTPATHDWPVEQVLLHAPQWVVDVATATHAPPQNI